MQNETRVWSPKLDGSTMSLRDTALVYAKRTPRAASKYDWGNRTRRPQHGLPGISADNLDEFHTTVDDNGTRQANRVRMRRTHSVEHDVMRREWDNFREANVNLKGISPHNRAKAKEFFYAWGDFRKPEERTAPRVITYTRSEAGFGSDTLTIVNTRGEAKSLPMGAFKAALDWHMPEDPSEKPSAYIPRPESAEDMGAFLAAVNGLCIEGEMPGFGKGLFVTESDATPTHETDRHTIMHAALHMEAVNGANRTRMERFMTAWNEFLTAGSDPRILTYTRGDRGFGSDTISITDGGGHQADIPMGAFKAALVFDAGETPDGKTSFKFTRPESGEDMHAFMDTLNRMSIDGHRPHLGEATLLGVPAAEPLQPRSVLMAIASPIAA